MIESEIIQAGTAKGSFEEPPWAEEFYRELCSYYRAARFYDGKPPSRLDLAHARHSMFYIDNTGQYHNVAREIDRVNSSSDDRRECSLTVLEPHLVIDGTGYRFDRDSKCSTQHIIVIGTQPSQEHDSKIVDLLSKGELITLPDEVLMEFKRIRLKRFIRYGSYFNSFAAAFYNA